MEEIATPMQEAMATTTGCAESCPQKSFLAIVPRGLEDKISSMVREKIPDAKIEILGEKEGFRDIGIRARPALEQHQQRKNRDKNPWFARSTGSFPLPPGEHNSVEHISVGYTDEIDCTWTCPGTLEGSVWLKIQVSESNILEFSSLRCLGPLLALVASNDDISSLRDAKHDMKSLIQDISDWISSVGESGFQQNLSGALGLWKEYVNLTWRSTLSESDMSGLEERIRKDQLRFRLSGLRSQEDATYPRHEFLRQLIDDLGHTLFPSYHGIGLDKGWQVNLTRFDIEFVVVCLSSGLLAMGISLLPYSFLDAKSFEKGNVPADVTKPFIGAETLKDLVRLRPTTANILLHFAKLQSSEVVLDPCAGIGTIPFETDIFCDNCVGLGGDIVLNHPKLSTAVASMEQIARDKPQGLHSSMFAAWDAAHLPIRSCSVDACVSDLPFGKQCLSSHAVKKLLPLLFLECARVLTINTGRMVLLCGNTSITESLKESEAYWQQPCTVAAPVNIGGLQAWVIRVERNGLNYDEKKYPRKLDRVRALAKKRESINRHRQRGGATETTKKRKIQR